MIGKMCRKGGCRVSAGCRLHVRRAWLGCARGPMGGPSVSSSGSPACGMGLTRNIAQSDCLHGSGGLEAVVYEPYRHGAFPDGGRSALDRPAADVSDGEDPRRAGLQEQRRSALVAEFGCGDIAAGEQKAVAVLCELAGQPLGSGLRADEDEQLEEFLVRGTLGCAASSSGRSADDIKLIPRRQGPRP